MPPIQLYRRHSWVPPDSSSFTPWVYGARPVTVRITVDKAKGSWQHNVTCSGCWSEKHSLAALPGAGQRRSLCPGYFLESMALNGRTRSITTLFSAAFTVTNILRRSLPRGRYGIASKRICLPGDGVDVTLPLRKPQGLQNRRTFPLSVV